MRWVLWAIRRPFWAIGIMGVVTLGAGVGLPRLELRMDGHALVPREDPAVVFDREVRACFGTRDPLIILIESDDPEGIYNPETLRRLEQLSEVVSAFEDIGPEHVMSLATERRDRVYPGTLSFRPFLDPFPDTPKLMKRLREDIEAIGILTGTLVAADGSATAILVGVPGSETDYDRAGLYHRLVAAAEPFQTPADRITVVGAPAAEALLGNHVLEDLAVLLPLAIGMMAIILGLRLRRIWGVILGLTEIAACLLFTFGLMGWLGFPFYLTTAVLPVVLITIGLADEIHVFFHYQLHLERSHGHEATAIVVQRTMTDMCPPVVLTSVTTGVGFISFLISSIDPIRAFGVFAAAGIIFCLLWTLLVIPAILTLLPAERLRAPKAHGGRRSWTLGSMIPFLRMPRLTLVALALVSIAVGLGLRGLYIQDSWIDGFAPASPFRRQTENVNHKLHGTHILLVHLETHGAAGSVPGGDGREGWLLDPVFLNELGLFEDYLRSRPEVGGVLGPHSHLSTVAHLWLGRKAGTRRIPDDPLSVARVFRFFEVVRGKHRRREVINDELNRALVTVFLKNANFVETRGLTAAIRGYEKRFAAQSVRLGLAGDVAVSQALVPALVRSQLLSLLVALVGVLLALSLLFRPFRLGVLALAPIALTVVWVLGAMGWLELPLGVATSMFCAISLGVGVDYAIHLLAGFLRARCAGNPDPVQRALRETGPAIVTDMLAISGSFGLLLISQVPANARLGLLVGIALAAACFLTLAGLGTWLSWKPPRFEVTAPDTWASAVQQPPGG
ncbi:MAG: MMPL family transporter [bacterium]|nr:MMPL family transporter [bacterium]